MSKGPGWVQRAIRALIEAGPDCAWTVEALCHLVYGDGIADKPRRVAVKRALAGMALPGSWSLLRLNRQGHGYCLADPTSFEAQLYMLWLQWCRPDRLDYEDWRMRADGMCPFSMSPMSYAQVAHERAAEARRRRDVAVDRAKEPA
jgi:hypothetical protein